MYEGALCVCCMNTDDLHELFVSKVVNNFEENYGKMLMTCLNIQICETAGHDSICKGCMSKLLDCVGFKRQCLTSMSILSSVALSDLMTQEDLEVLGLAVKKEEKDVDVIEDYAVLPRIEDFRHVDKTCNEDIDDLPISPEPVKVKRKPGRPRKMPLTGMPYKISKDELTCRECSQEFPNNITLKVHYNSHFGSHMCQVCDKGFMTFHSLKKHETSHLTGPFPCEACGQEFRSINTLHSHKRYKHSKRVPFRCRECPQSFVTFAQRLSHEAAAHARNQKRYQCKYCDKAFRHGGERSKHISRSHEIKLYPCTLCGARFRRSYMRAHLLRSHNVGPGHTCTECGAVHASRSALLKHVQSHLGDKRYVCKLCGKAFVQKCTLQYHIRSHIRRGLYSGDPNYLVVYKVDPKDRHNGMLSEDGADPESDDAQYLDENLLSEAEGLTLGNSIKFDEDLDQIDEILLDDDRFYLPSDLDVT